jgi:hypothetical protein
VLGGAPIGGSSDVVRFDQPIEPMTLGKMRSGAQLPLISE